MSEANEIEEEPELELWQEKRAQKWANDRKTLAYLLSEISIDEKTAKFAVSRFPPEWISQAVIQSKTGDRPKGLFCHFLQNPGEVKVPPKNLPANSREPRPTSAAKIQGPPATSAEVQSACEGILESLSDCSEKKGSKDGEEILRSEEERKKGHRRNRRRL